MTWLVWLSGLTAGLQGRGSLVEFLGRGYAWVAGQVPGGGHVGGSHTLMIDVSLPLFPPPFPSENKEIKSLKNSKQFQGI